jgi:hypothetical protein
MVGFVNKVNGFFRNYERGRAVAFGCVIVICCTMTTSRFAGLASASSPSIVHVWEKKELTFTSARTWNNPYTDVTVWVDLVGPGFRKRVFGFWDGDRIFRVRLLAPAAGEWTWHSGSNPPDPGLSGLHGSFKAIEWSEEEKQKNTLRRGFVRATANHHAVEQADGTPFFMTRSVRSGPRPGSKTISATARLKVTTQF